MLMTSIGRVGRSGAWSLDLPFFYAAGKCWIDGDSPYDQTSLVAHSQGTITNDKSPFAYPPTIAPFCMALALFAWPMACWIVFAINMICIAVIALLTYEQVIAQLGPAHGGRAAVAAAFIIGMPATSHVVWMGQSTLMVVAAVYLGWRAKQYHYPLLAGVLLSFAAIKPQFVILPFLWIILEMRHWRHLVVAACVALVLIAYPMLMRGPVNCIHDWLAAVHAYQSHRYSALGGEHIMGLPSLLVAAGLPAPPLMPLMLVIGIALFVCRRRIRTEDLLAVFTLATLGLVYAHDYDLCFIAPTIAAFAIYAHRRLNIALAALALAVLLYIPHRLVRILDMPLMLHWRTLVLLAGLALLLWLNAQADQPAAPPRQSQPD